MKIKEISISKLHNHFNYDGIKFNNDVTFLYGMNGSGKTTVLDILESIISGQIYKLFDYQFDKIILDYGDSSIDNNQIEIISNQNMLILKLDNEEYTLERIAENNSSMRNSKYGIRKETNIVKQREMTQIYMEEYPVLKNINKMFNHVYLPLNRTSNDDLLFEDERLIYQRNLSFHFDDIGEFYDFDLSMKEIEYLINNIYQKIAYKTRSIDEKFRNDVLKSLINIQLNYNEKSIMKNLFKQKLNPESIKKTKKNYINVMDNLSLLDKEKETEIDNFFSLLTTRIKEFDTQVDLQLLLQLNEVSRLNDIVNLADKTENEKRELNYPIELFLNTVNSFIKEDVDEKRIIILNGKIYFKTAYSKGKVPIHYLSSGEKQILSFFANLIFKIDSSSGGIYIVDEPELSLHLNWQKQFVDKALEINENIQFIFATHAPEIIGKRRNKMFKLHKTYNQLGEDYERE